MPSVTQSGRIIHVRTDKDDTFAAGLAQNLGLQATLTPGVNGYPLALAVHQRAVLRSIAITSKENLAWEIWLFGSSGFATTNADTEYFRGRWTFSATDGIQATIGATLDTYFHYYIDGLAIPIRNVAADVTGNIYLRLVNRSAAAKSAGAAGDMVIDLGLEPTQGY